MLPVHVAAANSLTAMYNFLVDLPGLSLEYDDMRANPEVASVYAIQTDLSVMQPLQVAARLGDKKLVQYILRSRSKKEWEWGPVAQYHMDLRGVDSIGETGNNVMEIVARLDATKETQEMVLDTFMGGFLNTLYVLKWRKLNVLHYLMSAFSLAFLLSLYITGFWLRAYPSSILHPETSDLPGLSSSLPYVTLLLIVIPLEEELRIALAWWRNLFSAPPDAETERLRQEGGMAGNSVILLRHLSELMSWMMSQKFHYKLLSWLFAIISSFMMIDLRSHADDSSYWDSSRVTPRDRTDLLLFPISFACFFGTIVLYRDILVEFPSLDILMTTIYDILVMDVSKCTRRPPLTSKSVDWISIGRHAITVCMPCADRYRASPLHPDLLQLRFHDVFHVSSIASRIYVWTLRALTGATPTVGACALCSQVSEIFAVQ